MFSGFGSWPVSHENETRTLPDLNQRHGHLAMFIYGNNIDTIIMCESSFSVNYRHHIFETQVFIKKKMKTSVGDRGLEPLASRTSIPRSTN